MNEALPIEQLVKMTWIFPGMAIVLLALETLYESTVDEAKAAYTTT